MEHIGAGGEMRAWNAAFERIIWKYILSPRYGFPEPAMEQWVCSAAEAAAMSLPRSLDQCASVTGVKEQKDHDGYELMMRMTRPRKYHPDGRIEWWEVEERKQRLYAYCKQDVRTERALVKVLRRLPPRERDVYLLDQRINDRGFQIDRTLVVAAKGIAEEGMDRANAALAEVTEGEVTKVSNVGRISSWLEQQGVETDSIDKTAVRDLLESDLDPNVRQVLELRQEAGKSSVKKLDSMLYCMCGDDRVRGSLLYHGASTGRWTGRLVQPHNMPRGELSPPDYKEETPYIEKFIPDVMAGHYDILSLYHNPLYVISAMLRSMITAGPGQDLIAADYSGIEARVLNVLAGQDDITAMFAAGEDVYSYNAGRLPGAEPYVRGKKHPWRQTGKFQELGCGFGMGAKTGVDQAKAQYQLEVSLEEMKVIVKGYRDTHPKVVEFWAEANISAMQAVNEPGSVITFGALRNLKFTKQGAYLYLILPGKRPLVFPAPRIVDRKTPWGEWLPAVEISTVNQKTKRWERQGMYGGLWVENIVQAVSRDIMAEGMFNAEAAGYPVVLDVHDEVVSEIPEGFGSLEEFQTLLTTPPEWAKGWPITTEGWRGKRYRK